MQVTQKIKVCDEKHRGKDLVDIKYLKNSKYYTGYYSSQ